MHRYTCEDCKKIFRSSDKNRIRCRKCLNINPSWSKNKESANRPNRPLHHSVKKMVKK